MDKSSKIYIAGHRGLVGSAIHRRLTEDGFTNIITRTSSELDLRDQAATETFFASEQPDYVFLAAAKVGGIHANNTYRADFIFDNLQIQNNVIGASYLHKAKKLLFLGSSCIYPKDAPQPITEDSLLTGPLEYTNEPYAIAKIAGIKLIESFNLQYGTNFLAVQPTNLYGRNDNFDLEKSHVMPALIRKLLLARLYETGDLASIADDLGIPNDPKQIETSLERYGISKDDSAVTLKVWGTGKPYREFLHVDDMAAACVYIMQKVNFKDLLSSESEIRNTQINIGTGSDLTISELAHMIKLMVGFTGKIAFDATKPDGTFRKQLSVQRLHDLGWKHTIALEDGISDLIDWYRQQKETDAAQ